ncbi:MAG TPA: hypothetical protein VFZ31_03725 [Vicinamibacterales bacterium]
MTQAAQTRLAVAIAAVAYLGSYLAVAAPAVLGFGVISQILFVLPGVLIVRAIAPAHGWLPAMAFGPFVGQALGSFVLTLLWLTGAHGVWLLAAAPSIVAILAMPARRLAGRWTLPAVHADDAVALAVLLLIVPVVAGLPFAHVGEISANGQDYRAYFTADYAWRRAVVTELAKGDVLPVNPYYAGDPLHYYWMPHVLSAVQYRFASGWATLDELLLIRSISIDAMLVAFLYGMTRAFNVRPWPAAGGVTFAILASSFEGLYALWDFARQGAPMRAVVNLNIDAISRWYFQGIPIDGLQRVLFYQPHHAVGYVIGMIGLLAIARRARAVDAAVFAVAGVCLGLSMAISSFAGLMLTAGAALFEAIALLRAFNVRRAAAHALAAGIPIALAVALVFALRYVDNSGSVVELTVNRVATHRFLWVTWLSMGPILVAGAVALWLVPRREHRLGIFGALAAVSAIFYFFINVRDHQDVYVGWRVGHFLFMSAAVLIGALLNTLSRRSRVHQVAWATVAIMFLAGLPTAAIDIYNTQDTTNHSEMPAGHWTYRLRPDDLQVFDWLRHNTDPKAIVQIDPVARGAEHWAYLPAFGERRMAAGLPISMVPLAKYERASAEIRLLYEEPPLLAYERAVRAGVDFILVGPPERDAHPGVEDRFNSIPSQLRLAFRNGTIAIYEILK